MLENVAGHKRCAVASHKDKRFRLKCFGRPGQVDQLRYVRQVIAREGHDIGAPFLDLTVVGRMVLNLKIEQANLVPGTLQRGRDEFDTQRLQPQENLRVKKRARMNGEYLHGQSRRVVCVSRASGQPLISRSKTSYYRSLRGYPRFCKRPGTAGTSKSSPAFSSFRSDAAHARTS